MAILSAGKSARKTRTKALTCRKCSTIDTSKRGHTGTATSMRCPDCADETGLATLCRHCCPTGHETRCEPEGGAQ